MRPTSDESLSALFAIVVALSAAGFGLFWAGHWPAPETAPERVAAVSTPAGATDAALPDAAPPCSEVPRSVPHLSRLLSEAREFRVRMVAAQALGSTDRPDCSWAEPALLAAVEHDESIVVRAAAATALGAVGDAIALPGLERAASGDADASVRAGAGEALVAIRAQLAPPNVP